VSRLEAGLVGSWNSVRTFATVRASLQVFARDGYYLCELGQGRGTGPGQFEGVCSVAITPDSILYASDWKNHRIQVGGG
jgi:hypothetical protein